MLVLSYTGNHCNKKVINYQTNIIKESLLYNKLLLIIKDT